MNEHRTVTQNEIDYHTLHHLRGLFPLLERLGGGACEQVSEPYIEENGAGPERFTPMGWEMAKAARAIAVGSAIYLDDVMARSLGEQDTELLHDVQQFLAVTAGALNGMAPDAAEGVDPSCVARGLLGMARDLLERVEAKDQAGCSAGAEG